LWDWWAGFPTRSYHVNNPESEDVTKNVAITKPIIIVADIRNTGKLTSNMTFLLFLYSQFSILIF
jgi:hypothetical protein